MTLLKILTNLIIFMISIFIPKSYKYIIIGGWYGKRYADNSRGMFEYLNAHKNEFGIKRIFWYTNSEVIYKKLKIQGYDVLYGISLRSIWWHFRSKVHMIDDTTQDILGFLSARCIRIDLWHGIPLKKVGYIDNNHLLPSTGLKKLVEFMSSGGYWDRRYVLATSDYTKEILSKVKNQPIDKFLVASYPRNIRLYSRLSYFEKLHNVFYLPTFRDNKEPNPLLSLDFNELNKRFKQQKIRFFVKPHFVDASNWKIKGNFSNIVILDASEDVYDWLYKTKLLITDYSSVFYDFLLTGRPILFFPYDFEYYQNNDRGFISPYNKVTPGRKIYRAEELTDNIIEIIDHPAQYMREYKKMYNEILMKTNKYIDVPNFDSVLNIMKVKKK